MARGVVMAWNAGRGFGFVQSGAYPEELFVHVSDVEGRVPLRTGQKVEFAAEMGDKGLRAIRVIPGRQGLSPTMSAGGLLVAVLVALAGSLHHFGAGWLVAVLGAIWAGTWFVYAWDKRRAGLHERRVPESVLLTLALIGGSPAALVAMVILRHKTRKISFQIKFAIVVLAQVGLAVLWFRGG